MLSRSAIKFAARRTAVPGVQACAAFTTPVATPARQFKYFDNLEVRDGIAIVRFNGPEKMNTISAHQNAEGGTKLLVLFPTVCRGMSLSIVYCIVVALACLDCNVTHYSYTFHCILLLCRNSIQTAF